MSSWCPFLDPYYHSNLRVQMIVVFNFGMSKTLGSTRVEVPITDHLREYMPNLEKYVAV